MTYKQYIRDVRKLSVLYAHFSDLGRRKNHFLYKNLLSCGSEIIPYCIKQLIDDEIVEWEPILLLKDLVGDHGAVIEEQAMGSFNLIRKAWIDWFNINNKIRYKIYM